MQIDNLQIVQPRAAGLDIHKMQITATVRLSQSGSDALTETGVFSALPDGLAQLARWLGEFAVTAAVMEATGVYWRAPLQALEDAGIEVRLVHAQQVRQLRGRKTDRNDSLWLSRVCPLGLARDSYVPPRLFRELRPLSRHRRKTVGDRSRVRNRIQKVLDGCGIRLGGVISNVLGTSGRRILNGLVQDRPREQLLARLTPGMVAKRALLEQTLATGLEPLSRWLLADLLAAYDGHCERIESIDGELESHLEPWADQLELLETIPGIDRASARAILVELGPDPAAFGDAARLAAWAGLCPGNNESAGKRRSGRTRQGSRWIRSTLTECAHGARSTKGCQFEGYHKALTVRRGYKRAIVATAHKLLRVIHAVRKSGAPYIDPEADYEALLVKRNAPRWIRMLKKHGEIEVLPDHSIRISRRPA